MGRAVLVITAVLVGSAGGSLPTASPGAASVADVNVVESGPPARLAAPLALSTAAWTTPAPRRSAATPSPSQSTAASGTWVVSTVPASTTNGGADVAQTTSDGAAWTHTVTSNLEEALRGGIDASVYQRARGNGDRWSGERLLEGLSPAVAGAGSKVYVAMLAYRCGGIGVLRNVDHGRSSAWEPVRCLRRLRWLGSPHAPEIAASRGTVIVSAAVPRGRHTRAWVSHDRGRSWLGFRFGLARGYGLGSGGVTRVAIDGQVAVVAWSDRRTIRARVSHDGGSTWGPRVTLGDGQVASAAVRDGQIVLAGVTREGIGWMQQSFDGTRWDQVAVPATSDYAMLVAAIGPSGEIGLAHTLCQGTGSSVIGDSTAWRTTSDLGATWSEAELVPGCAEEPKLAWTDGRLPAILDDGLDGYDLKLRLGDQP